jgi:hypothetical protein
MLSAAAAAARFHTQVEGKDRNMKAILKLLAAVALGAALSGCVVAPIGPPRRAYVGVVVPAPVVVVGGGYYHRW